MRNPFFCPAKLHGLFEHLRFHRFFAQKKLKLADLLIGRSKLRGGHDFFARCYGVQGTVFILPTPFEDLVSIDAMQAST